LDIDTKKFLTVEKTIDLLKEADRQGRIGPEEITNLARLFMVSFNTNAASNSSEPKQLIRAFKLIYSNPDRITAWIKEDLESRIKPSRYKAYESDPNEGWGFPPQTIDDWEKRFD